MAWRDRGVTIPVPDEGLQLEGVWQPGERGGAVIAPPHPEFGGSLEHPVANELAYALYKAGYASLRFNWRGVGASQGRITGDSRAAEADYRAAFEQLVESVEGHAIGAGYSFGAATALRVALGEPRIRRLLLVAPPVSMIRDLPLDRLAVPIHVFVGGRDTFAPPDELSEILGPLPDARVEVIPPADHFFVNDGLAALVQLAGAALEG
jgi:alpha/beta superfamily hydrolase